MQTLSWDELGYLIVFLYCMQSQPSLCPCSLSLILTYQVDGVIRLNDELGAHLCANIGLYLQLSLMSVNSLDINDLILPALGASCFMGRT